MDYNSFKLSLVVTVFVILSPLWVYINWYSILNQLFPFNDLNDKVVVDGIDITDYSERADIDEIYLVDTLTRSIRQLTNDNYRDKYPNISTSDERIYFVSNRFLNVNEDKTYGRSGFSLFFYDLSEQKIYSAYSTLTNIISDSTANINDLIIDDNLIAIKEYNDGIHKIKIGLLNSNKLLFEHIVHEFSIILDINKSDLTIRENGQLRTLKIRKELFPHFKIKTTSSSF